MSIKANLYTECVIGWEHRGYDREALVEVDYTYDGEELTITKWTTSDSLNGIDDDTLLDDIYEQVERDAASEYAEWLGDYGDYLYEQALDRRDVA